MSKKMRLQKEDISGSEFNDLNLAGAQFTNINLSGSRFHDINFSDVDFSAAQIGGTRFKHIGPPPRQDGKQDRQRPVTFEEGHLCGSVFRNMDLTDVEITGCDVTGMRIDGILVTDLLREWKKAHG